MTSVIHAAAFCSTSSSAVVICAVLFTIGGSLSSAEDIPTVKPVAPRRFEYKLSFKGPHLVQRDGVVPFWQHGGSAIASDESVRVTPSLKSKKGYMWSTQQNAHEHWEVEMVFRINGRGRLGADGLAFWYTEEKGVEGPVFGSNDKWKGLAIFMDSFDNDAQKNNPYIMAMVNDGTLSYNHDTDGSSQQLGGCLRDFRNRPFPLRIRVSYYNKALSIHFLNGGSSNTNDYELCVRVESVDLPTTGYFGISAATGGLADDHDVISFITHSITIPTDEQAAKPMGTITSEDREQFEKEFDEYWKKLETAKEEYKKEHPEAREEHDETQNYVTQESKELKMIFEGQNAIHQHLRQLHDILDNTASRVEVAVQKALTTQQGGTATSPDGAPVSSGMRQEDVTTIISSQHELLVNFKDIRSSMELLSGKTDQVRLAASDTNDIRQQNDLIKSSVGVIQNDLRTLLNKPTPQAKPCESQDSCVTGFQLFIFMFAQMLVVIGYNIYRQRQAAAAKKFY